jgi:ribulose-phosphate 3-epimerase
MSVNPGFGGQKFLPLALDKIQAVRRKIDAVSEKQNGRPIDLEVDGGITADNAASVIKAGADVLVAGTASFTGGAPRYADNIARLRR